MNKNVLVITPPTEFMVFDKFRSCLRFSAIGGNLIAEMIDKTKYDVDYFDIDAYMIHKFNHISDYFESESQLMHELKYYLRKEVKSNKREFFVNITKLIGLVVPKDQYDYVLCSLPCYGNSREDCENQMRMACIILAHLKAIKGNPITVAGGNWWENLDVEYWKRNVVEPSQIIDFLIFGSMQNDELDDLLDRGYAQKAYHRNPEKDPNKSYVGKGVLVGKDLGDWGGYYKLGNTEEVGSAMFIPDQIPFVNRKDLRYEFKDVFDYYKVKNPEPSVDDYIQQASMFFMEGCVGNCAFCESGDKKLKILPFDQITDRIKSYVYDLGYNSFFFKNSAINPTRKFVDKFCSWLIKENLNILWSDSARFHDTDSDLFDMLWESGCRSLGWGCESADDSMLRHINKNLTVKEMTEGLWLSHEKGIWNVMNFIFGMPGETPAMVENTIEWINEHSICMDECNYNEYCPKPNSPFLLTPEKFGLDKEGDNVLDPNLGLNVGQTNKYRNELRKLVRDRLFEIRQLELHTSQILTFPLYRIFNHDKLEVREWLDNHYKPYNDIVKQTGGN